MAENNIAPHGARGPLYAPAWHRPFLRYIDGEQGGGTGEQTPGSKSSDDGTDWKSEARKWEQRAKDNKSRADANDEAARKLAGIEDANKTAEAKNAERITELEKKLAAAERTALVARVQASHGISDEDAALFLTGGDESSLTAQAKRLAERASSAPVAPREGTARNSSSDDPMREYARRLFNSEE